MVVISRDSLEEVCLSFFSKGRLGETRGGASTAVSAEAGIDEPTKTLNDLSLSANGEVAPTAWNVRSECSPSILIATE